MIENQEFINPALDDFKFYERSMSKALSGSFGVTEQCEMYFNILENVLKNGSDIFDFINIFYFRNLNDNYFTKTGIDPEGTSSRWIDAIASIYKINRNVMLNGVSTILNNLELIIYIEATIARYNFDGSQESINKYYNGTFTLFYDALDRTQYTAEELKILDSFYKGSFLTQLNIQYVPTTSLNCDLYMDPLTKITIKGQDYEVPHLQDLYENGFLSVDSLGIIYNRSENYISKLKILNPQIGESYGIQVVIDNSSIMEVLGFDSQDPVQSNTYYSKKSSKKQFSLGIRIKTTGYASGDGFYLKIVDSNNAVIPATVKWNVFDNNSSKIATVANSEGFASFAQGYDPAINSITYFIADVTLTEE